MYKKIISLVFTTLLLVAPIITPAYKAQTGTSTIELDFFWRNGCPHCGKAKPFLEELAADHKEITLNSYEIYYNRDNAALLQQKAAELGVREYGVPFLVIGDEYVIGYGTDETTGREIISIVETQLGYPLINNVEPTQDVEQQPVEPSAQPTDGDNLISVPILNEIDPATVSLPLLAITLGVVDGFNPCAMWALLFIIGLLINLKDRKKLMLLGTLFILTSGFVYFLFMSAWLNLFLFVGYIAAIRILIGLAAIAAGVYYFYDYCKHKDGGCGKGEKAKRKATFQKAKDIVTNRNLLLASFGIIALAVSVNMIELVCSAGLPAIFTQVLSLNDLSTVSYYGLMLLYILFFMLDDLVIFIAAVYSFKLIGIENKYSRASRLIGGILIFVIGILLIFKPEWLLFG